MAVVVTTIGAGYFGKVILGITVPDGLTVKLFVNLRNPTTEDILANYTECTWPGYSEITLMPPQWAAVVAHGVAQFTYPVIKYEFDPSNQVQQTVFGYLVCTKGGILLYAEAFTAPFPIPPEGGEIPLILVWTDEQCSP